MGPMEELVAAVRTAPGLLGKRDLQVVKRLGVDGDDAAAVPHGDGYLIVCGEAMSPPFLKADPFGAGAAAVVTNVSDVRAMGGTPLAIVDMLISPDAEHANTVLDGMAWASGKLGVPIVGGHLTLGHEPALSASCTGFARRPLRAEQRAARRHARRRVRHRGPLDERDAAVLDVAPRPRRQPSSGPTATRWSRSPEHGLAHAARDVSMPGIAGSLLQMIEGAGCGANLNVEAIPRPDGAPIERWLMVFPSFGFLLATRQPDEVLEVFARHGLAAAVCGSFDDTRVLRLNEFPAWDLNETPLTGLSPSAGA